MPAADALTMTALSSATRHAPPPFPTVLRYGTARSPARSAAQRAHNRHSRSTSLAAQGCTVRLYGTTFNHGLVEQEFTLSDRDALFILLTARAATVSARNGREGRAAAAGQTTAHLQRATSHSADVEGGLSMYARSRQLSTVCRYMPRRLQTCQYTHTCMSPCMHTPPDDSAFPRQKLFPGRGFSQCYKT
eukprot:365225-Chlamydomonas_euryale.AAC.4